MGFHEKFGDIVRRRLKADRRHTSGRRSPRAPLRNSGLHLWLAVPVWPLGGAKRLSLTLDVSAISEPIGAIFSPYSRSRRGLQIPLIESVATAFGLGVSPQKRFFFDRLVTRNSKFLTSQVLHTGDANWLPVYCPCEVHRRKCVLMACLGTKTDHVKFDSP